MSEHQSRRDELAAYLLGALEPDEAVEIERHLGGCETCREELAWLRPALDLVHEAVPRHEAPAALRERVMEEVRGAPAPARRPSRAAWWRRGGWLALRPAIALAGVALLAAGVAGYSVHDRIGGEDESRATFADRQHGVDMRLARDGDAGTLKVAGLRQLRSGEVYQAWVQHDRRVSPSEVFVPKRNGSASAAIPHGLEDADAIMVTVEPRGGSRRPGSAPVLEMALD